MQYGVNVKKQKNRITIEKEQKRNLKFEIGKNRKEESLKREKQTQNIPVPKNTHSPKKESS